MTGPSEARTPLPGNEAQSNPTTNNSCPLLGDAQCGNAKDLSADEQSDLENLTRVCKETFYCFDKILSYFKGNVPHAEATLRRFCGADDMQSCFYLGMFDQVTFRGRPQNLAKALALYNYACRNGFANGCVRLAMMYDAGADVTRDERTAADYFHKAQ
ncbi:MAG: tetratricopeptide repeat protein, partial [Aestuariivirgaceae bacterium]